ncbi:MAG: prolipoprotein diacylglyceryl transferase [Deltaproteobacteria bacterium]|nr:prolipoprotein diacylglyceryl transferase [Deltaproteobacteria bacterium]
MYPTLFTIPYLGFKVHSYGVMVALAFFLGMQVISREAKRQGLPADKILDLCFYIIIAAIVGSRVFYILVEEPHLLLSPLDWFKIWEGGLVFYGGFIGSLAVGFWYLHKHRLNFLKTVDVFILALPLGHSLGRIGCFLAGCCYGKPAPHFPFSVVFPLTSESIAPVGVPLFPTQLMESIAELLVFVFLFWKSRKKKFDGQILLLYLVLYSIVRSVVEVFRGDISRGFVWDEKISVAQGISVVLVIVALILWKKLSKKSPLP